MKAFLQSTIYVLLPSIILWWFLHRSAPQRVNRIGSDEVRQIQRHDGNVQAKIEAIWKRIENCLDEKGWAEEVRLNPPATLQQIEALEQRLGYRLVGDYKASLLVHNGCEGEFCSHYRLSTTDDVLSVWETYVGVYGDYAQDGVFPDPEKVMSYYWHPGWAPAACWDVYCTIVNLETGRVYYRDDANAVHDAKSWTVWLETVASRLESGEFQLERSGSGRMHWSRSDYATPGSEVKRW